MAALICVALMKGWREAFKNSLRLSSWASPNSFLRLPNIQRLVTYIALHWPMVTTLPLWNCLTGVASITLPLHFPELLQICTYMLNHSFEQVESRITLCGLNNFVNWPKTWMGMSWIGYELNDLGCGDVDVLAPPVGADGWSNATIWGTISFESVNQTKMTSSHLKIVSLLWLFLNWWLIHPSSPNALKKLVLLLARCKLSNATMFKVFIIVSSTSLLIWVAQYLFDSMLLPLFCYFYKSCKSSFVF